MATRLQEKYTSEVRKGLMEKFNYKNVNELPKLEKVVINIGCGDAVTNSKAIDSAVEDLTVISGQKPSSRKPRNPSLLSNCVKACPLVSRLRSAAAACMNSLINS